MRLTPWLSMFSKSPLRKSALQPQRRVRSVAYSSAEQLEERVVPAAVIVSPGAVSSWVIDVRDGNGILINNNPDAGGAYVTGPSTPPIGSGSLNLYAGNGTTGGDGPVEVRSTAYDGILLTSLTSLSYDTYATAWNGQQLPYLGLDIDTDDDGIADDSIFFEPPYQTPSSGNPLLPDQGHEALNVWQHWNALTGGWWSNSSTGGADPGDQVKPLSAIYGVYPNAKIVNSASGLGGVRLSIAYTSPNDTFNANIDNVTIGVSGAANTFNFENIAPTTAYVNASWAGLSQGVDPDGAGPATVLGGDAFTTIQAAVNAVAAGGTINIYSGTYAENVSVTKSLTLDGVGSTATNIKIQPASGIALATTGAAATVIVNDLQLSGAGTGISATGQTTLTLNNVMNNATTGGTIGSTTTLNYTAGTGVDTIAASATSLSNTGALTFNSVTLSSISNLAIDGAAGNDSITVTPPAAPGTAISANGGADIDTLTYNAAGGSPNVQPTVISETGKQDVSYATFENVTLQNVTGPVLAQGTGGADKFEVRNNAGTVEFRTNGGPWVAVTTGPLNITGGVGDDTLVLDFAAGNPIPTGGLTFDGGTGGNDKLAIHGNNTQTVVYKPDAATNGSGKITVNGSIIDFSNLEPVDFDNVGAFSLVLPGANDIVDVSTGTNSAITTALEPAGTIQALVLSGSSGGVNFEAAHVFRTASVTIDTTAVAGTDAITITSANNAHGNSALTITTGVEAGDTITVNGTTTFTGTTTLNAKTISLNANVTNAVTGSTATLVNVASPGQIQDGINVALSGATTVVNVAAGTYTENLVLGKQINLKGAQSGVDARGRAATETIITPAVAATRTLELITGVAGSIIDGITFTGTTGRGIESTSGNLNNLQLINNRFTGYTTNAVFLNDPGTDITVNQNSLDGSNNTTGVSGFFHLDQDNFNGFYFTNNWVLNAAGTEGLYVDGDHNVGPSGLRTPLIDGNLFDHNDVGANLGRFAFGSFATANAGTISNNTFSNNDFDGLQGGIQHVLVTQNSFTGNGRAGLALTGFGGAGVANRGAQNSVVTQNFFSSNVQRDVSFASDQFPGTIATNALFNNSLGSVVAITYNGTETIQASGNWFGTSSNPENVIVKFSGTGAGFIDYSPWLNSGTDTAGGTAGFQGDFSNLHVDDDSAFSTLAYGTVTPVASKYITEGYDLLTATGTLNVHTGSYTENVDLGAGANKAVTLAAGASPGQVVLTGNLTLTANDTLPVDLNGSSAALYDSFQVSGTVDLGGATLSPTLTFTPTGGTAFTIVDKTSAGAITGTFNGIVESHVYTLGGFQFQATYLGGLGDDNNFVLSYIDPANPIINGTPGSDVLKVALDAGGTLLQTFIGGVLVDSRALASVTTFAVNGLGGGDTLTVDYTNGNPIPSGGMTFDGGAGASDKLIISGTPTFNTLKYDTLAAGAGTLTIDTASVIHFAGLEPVVVVPVVGVVTIDVDPSSLIAGTVTSTFTDAGAGTNLVSFTGGLESMTFANPSAELVVNGDNVDNDNIIFTSLNAGFNAKLTVNGNGGAADVITLNTALTLGSATATGDVTLTAETINLGANINTDAGPATSGNVSLTGTTINVTAPVTIDTNGVTDGTLTVSGAVHGAGQTLTLDIGPANNVLLNNAGNNFGTVAVTTGNNVTLNDTNAIDLGASTISGNLIVTSGAITDSGAVLITGTTSLTAGANPITLDDLNNFGGSVTVVSGSVVVLNDINAIDIAAATISNTLTVTAVGAVTDSGNISVANNASFSGSAITLGDAGGETTNFGTLTFNSVGAVAISEDTNTALAGANTANSLNLTSAGAITDGSTSLAVTTQATFSGTAITIGGGGTTTALTDVTFTSGGAVSIQEDSGINLTGANTASSLILNVTGNITEAGTVTTGTTNLTGAVITMTTANVFGAITVNDGTGAVSITENSTMDIAGIIHNGGLLTLQAGANIINVNGAIAITGGNAQLLTTTTLNLLDNITATVISGTAVTVNVQNNTAQIQDGVDAGLPAGATVQVNANATFSEHVVINNTNIALVATVNTVTINSPTANPALTVSGTSVASATGFTMTSNTAADTVSVTGGSLTLRNNFISESSTATQTAIHVTGGALNLGVTGTSTPGNNSIVPSGTGTMLTTTVGVDASGNWWGSNVFATITAGLSGAIDYTPYLNNGTDVGGVGFFGDFSDVTAHATGTQAGVAAITEAYNMLTPVGTIHALTGSYTESVDLGAGSNKAVTFAAGASPGQVDISGALTLTSNDTLPIELTSFVMPPAAGPVSVGTTFDNFNVHGTVTLGNATLVPTISYGAQPYDRFTIINNQSGIPVVGQFNNQPEGSVMTVSGVRLRVSYVEFHQPSSNPSTPGFFGDGNDVSLTVMLPPIVVTQGVNGDLTIDGTGWNDDITLSFTGTNQLTLIGNDVSNFTGPLTTNIQLAGPYTVSGNITVKLGNGKDKVLLRGVGANATYDSGNLVVDLGSDDDTFTTIDSATPPIITAGLKMTGNISIIGGAGTDNVTLGSATATDTLLVRDLTIDTGDGLAQTISLDRLTATRNVTLTNGGSAAQTVAMGVNAANLVTGNLIINQPASASSYTVGLHNTGVGGFLTVTNGNGSGAAAVTIDTTTAQAVNGATTITNGNNLSNAVTIVGTTGGLQLKGSIAIKNGTATNTNGITITNITDSGNSATNLTNGASPANTITFNGAVSNTFLGLVTATNGPTTGTNTITATRLSSTKGINLNNGAATVAVNASNIVTVGGAGATDLVSVTGNLVISNGIAVTTTIGIDHLTTIGANPVGNVTINNQATGTGGTGVTLGANAVNSISGNLQITNQSSTGTRSVLMNQTTVSGRTGVNIYEVGTGNTSLTIGNAAASTISKGLVVQDGSGSSTVSLQNLTVGNFNYLDLGGGTDNLDLGDTAGTFRVNGVTRIDTGAGSDTVRLATTGTAILNDTVFIALGSGNDLLFIGANANSPALNGASKFLFDGGAGDDTFNASPLSVAEYSGSPLGKKVKSKIMNFEHLSIN